MDTRAFLAEYLTPPVSWPIAIGLAVAVVAALELVYRFVFRWLSRLSDKTTTHLDDVLVKRMRLPAQVLVFLVGANVLFAARDIDDATVSKIVNIVELLLVAYLIIEALETAILDFWLGQRKSVAVPGVVRGLLLVVLYAVAIAIIIGTVTGVNVAPILATSTVVTVVVGLALQDTLGNLFSGLALNLEKPFVVGDWILVDNVEGRVESMGWRAVHLRTFSWDLVAVPNGMIAKARVQNFSRPERVTARNVDVIVPANADPDAVEAVARTALKTVAAVKLDPEPRVWLVEQTPLAQRWLLKVWVDDFAIHDETESQVRRAFVKVSRESGLEWQQKQPAAAVVAGPSA